MALPDTRACWPVAACAAIYVFFGMMLAKSESVLYVGFMDMLQANREDASWPLTLAIITSQLAGPLYGLLGLWLSDRVLLIAGALLCSLPVMACALTKSLGLIIFLYGVLYGLGVACEEVLPFTVVARHFVRLRGTAMSLLFVVTAVSGFVSPLFVEMLRENLEFPTALLILGALELNMLFGCIFVNRVPPNSDSAAAGRDGGDSEEDDIITEAPVPPARRRTSSFHTASLAHSCSKEIVESITAPRSGWNASPAISRTWPTLSCSDVLPSSVWQRARTAWMYETLTARAQRPHEAEPLLPQQPESAGKKFVRNLRLLASVPFVHVAASRAVSVFVLSSFLLTAVDFGTDNGLVGYQAVALVTASAVGDLVARIVTGLVLDYKILSGDSLMLCTFASQAAALAILGLVKNYWFLVASCFVSGLSAGSRIFASTIMVAELFDERALPLSLGVTNFFAGVFCLARPSLIGFARDVIGSYDPLYIAFAVTNGVFTVTWTISFFCQRCRRPREWKHVNGFAGTNQEETQH
ncbi:monocarboxylate transporter 12-B-like isoform X2 [Haemaphysalis longicornis]